MCIRDRSETVHIYIRIEGLASKSKNIEAGNECIFPHERACSFFKVSARSHSQFMCHSQLRLVGRSGSVRVSHSNATFISGSLRMIAVPRQISYVSTR